MTVLRETCKSSLGKLSVMFHFILAHCTTIYQSAFISGSVLSIDAIADLETLAVFLIIRVSPA